ELPTIRALGCTMRRASGSGWSTGLTTDRLAPTARRLQASLASLHRYPKTPYMPAPLSHGFGQGAIELARQPFGEPEPSARQDQRGGMMPRQSIASLKLVRANERTVRRVDLVNLDPCIAGSGEKHRDNRP